MSITLCVTCVPHKHRVSEEVRKVALAESRWASLPGWRFYPARPKPCLFLSEIHHWPVAAQGAMFDVMQRYGEGGTELGESKVVSARLKALMVPLEEAVYGLLFAGQEALDGSSLALGAFKNHHHAVPLWPRLRAEWRLRHYLARR
jgi:hypothetical protein